MLPRGMMIHKWYCEVVSLPKIFASGRADYICQSTKFYQKKRYLISQLFSHLGGRIPWFWTIGQGKDSRNVARIYTPGYCRCQNIRFRCAQCAPPRCRFFSLKNIWENIRQVKLLGHLSEMFPQNIKIILRFFTGLHSKPVSRRFM